MTNEKKQPKEKKNGFVRFLRFVFVHNWGLKLTAIVSAVVLWMSTVGFAV